VDEKIFNDFIKATKMNTIFDFEIELIIIVDQNNWISLKPKTPNELFNYS
jgi:hypothetical protein